MKCEDCGNPTQVIERRIGFFGLNETYCQYCRDCLPNHAAEYGWTPEHTLSLYDELVSAVQRAKEAHQAKSQAQA